MLDAFEQWLQAHQSSLEAEGITFEFYSEREEQAVKTNNLNVIYGQYEGGICLWEHGSCNVTLADLEAHPPVPIDECCSWAEIQLDSPDDLDVVASSFFQMLVKLPGEHLSARLAISRYWDSLPIHIRH